MLDKRTNLFFVPTMMISWEFFPKSKLTICPYLISLFLMNEIERRMNEKAIKISFIFSPLYEEFNIRTAC